MKSVIQTIILLTFLLIIFSCSEEDKLLYIENNASVEGWVFYEEGSSAQNIADVRFMSSDSLVSEVKTDTTGYFKQDRLYEGNYEIIIDAEGYFYSKKMIFLENHIITTLPPDTLMRSASAIEGYVEFTNAFTDTVSAKVSVYYSGEKYAETYTDTQGYYLLENLVYGENEVKISADGFMDSNISVTLKNDSLSIIETVILSEEIQMTIRTVLIDGEIDDGWNPVYTEEHISNWGPNDFDKLYMAYDDNYFFIAVTGQFSTGDNTVSICLDIDSDPSTGINNFREVSGGDIGNQIRKNIDAPDEFGADIAFNSGWALSGECVVSLENPSAVDQALFEDVNISMNDSVLEIAISLEEMYNGVTPSMISLVGYIGGGGDQYFANDVLPQGDGDFEGTFYEVLTIGF